MLMAKLGSGRPWKPLPEPIRERTPSIRPLSTELARFVNLEEQFFQRFGPISFSGSGSLVIGSPAKVVRPLTAMEKASIKSLADKYVSVAAYHRNWLNQQTRSIS
jgi:hypothetical protein